VGRKIFWGALTVGIVMLVVGVVTLLALRSTITASAHEELVRQADVTASIVEEELSEDGPGPGRDGGRHLRGLQGDVDRVLDRAGVVAGYDVAAAAVITPEGAVPLSRDRELLLALPSDAVAGEVVQVEVNGTEMLATARWVDFEPGQLVVAIAREAPLFPLGTVSWALIVAVGIGSILMLTFGLWFARNTSRRLGDLEAAATRIAAGDLGARAPVDGDDEVTEVSLAFNEMAARLEAGRDRERQFLMNVSHDLRTPLTTIRGYAEELDAGHIENGDVARVAAVLHAETDRLSRLIEDVMLIARIEAREFTLRPEPVDLGPHLGEIFDAERDRAAAAGVTLAHDHDDVGVVTVDPDRVAQVCRNLLENAIRATPPDGSVTLSLRRVEDSVMLSVADTGPGIEVGDLDRVFGRFYVPQRSRAVRPEGSGLGLAIVKELVDAMDGEVHVSSSEAGTEFTVTLPA